jgi:GMP synthase (glutamine-hydrolysing)
MEALQNTQQYNLVSQAYAALLDSKCTCVRGDQRGYAHIIMLRAVVTSDFMTAHYKKLDWEFLDSVSRKITNQIKEVGKVVYDITNKPPSTIELE